MNRPHGLQCFAPLSIEQLENRVPLAGDVSAALSSAGDLMLKGDNSENFVFVFIRPGSAGSPDQLVVQGDTSPDGAATTVGGQAEKTFTMPAVLRTINASLGKALTAPNDARGPLGTDAILVTDLTLSGDLSIKGQNAGGVALLGVDVRGKTTLSFSGGGLLASGTATALEIGSAFIIANSRLGLGPAGAPDSTPHKDVVISDGTRGGFVYLGGATVGRNLNIVTKAGLDQVIVGEEIDFTGLADALGFPIAQQAVTTPTFVQGNLKIDTGGSDDFITVVNVDVRGSTTVKSGLANDDVIIGDTHNAGQITTLHGPTTIDLGAGDPATAPFGDWFVMAGSLTSSQTAAATTTCDGNLTLTSKTGNDSFGLFGVGVRGSLALTSGTGHDHIDAINFAVLGAANFKTGDGDDTVFLDIFSTFAGSSLIGQTLSIDSGKGFDYLAIDHVQFLGKITLKAGADNDTVVFKGGASIAPGLAHSLDGGAGIHDELDETVFGGNADKFFEDFGIALGPFYDEIFAEVDNDFGDVLADMGIPGRRPSVLFCAIVVFRSAKERPFAERKATFLGHHLRPLNHAASSASARRVALACQCEVRFVRPFGEGRKRDFGKRLPGDKSVSVESGLQASNPGKNIWGRKIMPDFSAPDFFACYELARYVNLGDNQQRPCRAPTNAQNGVSRRVALACQCESRFARPSGKRRKGYFGRRLSHSNKRLTSMVRPNALRSTLVRESGIAKRSLAAEVQ